MRNPIKPPHRGEIVNPNLDPGDYRYLEKRADSMTYRDWLLSSSLIFLGIVASIGVVAAVILIMLAVWPWSAYTVGIGLLLFGVSLGTVKYLYRKGKIEW